MVILPERRIRRPVAKGSRVPVWPTLTLWPNLSRSPERTLATTPKLLIPVGLSINMIWSSFIVSLNVTTDKGKNQCIVLEFGVV